MLFSVIPEKPVSAPWETTRTFNELSDMTSITVKYVNNGTSVNNRLRVSCFQRDFLSSWGNLIGPAYSGQTGNNRHEITLNNVKYQEKVPISLDTNEKVAVKS